MNRSHIRPFAKRLSASVRDIAAHPSGGVAVLTGDAIELLDLALRPIERIEGERFDGSRLVALGDGRLLVLAPTFGPLYTASCGGRIEKVDLGDDYASEVVATAEGFVAVVGSRLLFDRRGERRWVELEGRASGVARCGQEILAAGRGGVVVLDASGEVCARHEAPVGEAPVTVDGGALLLTDEETVVFDGRREIARLPLAARATELVPFLGGALHCGDAAVTFWSWEGGRVEQRWRWQSPGLARTPEPIGERVVVGVYDAPVAWILDAAEGHQLAEVKLGGPLAQAAALGDGIAIRARASYDVAWWRPAAETTTLEHDATPWHMRSVGAALVSAEDDVIYSWRADEQGPDVAELASGGLPFDVPIVAFGSVMTVRRGGRFSLRAETDAGFSAIRPGVAHRLATTRDEALALVAELASRRTDGPMVEVPLDGTYGDTARALAQLPLHATLPLHARALFAPSGMDPELRARVAHARGAWFGELALALGVSPRVAMAAARAGRFPLEPPHAVEGFEYLGVFTTDGALAIADPCYRGKKAVGRIGFSLAADATPGRWHVFVRPGAPPDARRTAELVVVHERALGVAAVEAIGSIPVDSGTAGVFDAACPKRKDDDDLYDEGVISGLGAIAHTGFGDGFYPVFTGSDASGRVAKIRIHFMGPSPEQLDTTVARRSAGSRRYSPKEHFEPGDAVEHARFGAGTVVRATPEGKIEVAFADGARVLVHAR